MASKRLRQPETSLPPGADDFKIINGIGPGVAQRLYNADILTFAQLADLSIDQIASLVADLAGLSAERIAKQDWSGQARDLVLEQPMAGQRSGLLDMAPFEPHDDMTIPQNRQHYAMFNVELLLNQENEVRRTRVTHVQEGREDIWAGWQASRLIDFFVQRAALNVPLAEPVPMIAEAAELAVAVEAAAELEAAELEAAELAVAVEAAAELEAAEVVAEQEAIELEALPSSFARALRLREFELVPTSDNTPRRMLRAGEPFTIDLTLDLADMTLPHHALFDYTLTIYAKKMGSGLNQTVTEARGAIAAAETIMISAEGAALASGLYRMEGVVAIGPSDRTRAHGSLRAMIEGDLFQVY